MGYDLADFGQIRTVPGGLVGPITKIKWSKSPRDKNDVVIRAHNLCHDNLQLIVLAINCNHSASKNNGN